MRTETRRHRDPFLLQCLCRGIVMKQQKKKNKPKLNSRALISMWECYNCNRCPFHARRSNELHRCTFFPYAASLAAPPVRFLRANAWARAPVCVWRANRLIVIAARAEIVMEPRVCRE